MTSPKRAEWLTAGESAEILGFSGVRSVNRLAHKGLIRVRTLPGTRARYSAADVRRLASADAGPAESLPPA